MKSIVLCVVLLALAATSTQASGVKSARSNSLQWKCDVSGIGKLITNIVSDSIAVVFSVRAELDGILNDALTCARKDLTNPELLVKCVVSESETEIDAAYNTVKEYLTDLKFAVQDLKVKVEQCTKL